MPTVNTTAHISTPAVPEGGLTYNGRRKYRNKVTGRVSYIDQKIGTNMGPDGNPTHKR